MRLNELKDKIMKLISVYPGPVIGCLTGLLAGLLIITFGPLKLILLVVCILLGTFLGYVITNRMKE